MRLLMSSVVLSAGLLLATPAVAAPQDAQVGHVRAVVARKGTPLLEQPRAIGGKVVRTLVYGERIRIVEKRGTTWFRVQTLTGGTVTGWVRMNQTVAPYALSGPGRLGNTGTPLRGTRAARARGLNLANSEQAAAARGHQKSLEAGVGRDFAAVDRLEAKSEPRTKVERFVAAGGLGRPRN